MYSVLITVLFSIFKLRSCSPQDKQLLFSQSCSALEFNQSTNLKKSDLTVQEKKDKIEK